MNEVDARHRARTFVAGVRPPMGIPDTQAYAMAAKARIRFEALDEGESGYTIPTPTGFAITVNGNESQERQRFTICHEIAHIILELPSKHEELPSWSYAKRDLNEVLCDIFASELLMPYEYFLKRIPGDQPSVEVIEALAEEFATSFPATASRYASLVVFPCAYVTMERDFVRYAAPNGALRRKGIAIPIKCAIPADRWPNGCERLGNGPPRPSRSPRTCGSRTARRVPICGSSLAITASLIKRSRFCGAPRMSCRRARSTALTSVST